MCREVEAKEGGSVCVKGKGTRVEASESTSEGTSGCGVEVSENANVQLDKCTAGSNELNIVQAASGAVVGLTGCTVADSWQGGCNPEAAPASVSEDSRVLSRHRFEEHKAIKAHTRLLGDMREM
jgi:hypothetical protein